MARKDHWLNTRWWMLTVAEWIGLLLALCGIISLFCILFIRRHTLEYHLEHTFVVNDAEFFSSALAMADPLPVEGNAIEALQNGDEFFRPCLRPFAPLGKPSISRLTLFIRMKLDAPFAKR